MADKYVWSGATGAADGSSWTDAYTTIAAGIAGAGGTAGGGSTVWVHTGASNTHSESINAADVNWDGPTGSSLSGVINIVGVDKDDSDSYQISASANVTLPSTFDLNIDGAFAIYGLRFVVSGTTGYINSQTDVNEHGYYQDCYFDTSGYTGTYGMSFGSSYIQFKNCTINRGSDDNYVNLIGTHCEFVGCTFTGSSTGYAFFAGPNPKVKFIGCDLSGVSMPEPVPDSSGYWEFFGCKLNSAFAISAAEGYSGKVHLYETDDDSSNNAVRIELFGYGANTCNVDSAYRSGGATYDGTNGYSYVLTAFDADQTNLTAYTPWSTGFLSNTGERTFTVYIANATADYDDTQIWLEVEYFGSASTTLKTIATDGETDPTVAIGSGTTQTDDTSSTWSPSKTYMQKLSVTATVNRAGSYRWRVGSRVATDIYIDPKIEIT